ncbi:hypothetical protein QUF74_11725 [Candidatus Halobeggiatoa sp. HSG11]|nr:hypothetical protein [Candidatus Halobeggiatoa sp. HSG11]
MLSKENILKKALVGFGFNPYFLRSLRGDRSMRDTVYSRERCYSYLDEHSKALFKIFSHLLFNTGVHRLDIGFNNSQIDTFSIFDPLNMEIHTARNLLDDEYLQTSFPLVSWDEKDAFIKRFYQQILPRDDIFMKLPEDWQQNFRERNRQMKELTNVNQLNYLLETLPKLRELEGYYLRVANISLFNSSVSLSFNCDGTQILAHNAFADFIEENIG